MKLPSRKLFLSVGAITYLSLACGNSYYLFAQTKAASPFAAACTPANIPTFKPGQVVSADTFNEIFSRLDNVTAGFRSASELVGIWSCSDSQVAPDIYDPNCARTGFYTFDPSGMFATLTDTVVFMADTGGGSSFRYASARYPLNTCSQINGVTPPNPAIALPETGRYLITNNHLLFKIDSSANWVIPYASAGLYGPFPLHKTSKYSFVFNNSINSRLFACDRQDIPPVDPTDLSASVSGRSVTLVWANGCNSTATSLKVLRKDSLNGNYSAVATLAATVTTYAETVPSAGTYWYRIAATNTYGDSNGSNVADITAQ